MQNRELLFEKIEAKEKEWEAQVAALQAKVADFNPEVRIKVEEQINHLKIKLKEIESQTIKFKKISSEIPSDSRERMIYSWIELFTKIDNAMLKLKNK